MAVGIRNLKYRVLPHLEDVGNLRCSIKGPLPRRFDQIKRSRTACQTCLSKSKSSATAGPKDQINIRISCSGSKAQQERLQKL